MTRPSFGLLFSDFRGPPETLFEDLSKVAGAAENAGFESLWVMDHFHQHPPYWRRTDPMLEAYVVLAALAARTSRANVGVLVSGVLHRNPAVLAKMTTTLDVISSGRAVLGIGASWNEDVFVSYGFGTQEPSIGERLDRLEEALQICVGMLRDGRVTFGGRYYQANDAINEPRPLRATGVPILVGGSGKKRLLRLAAEYADISNVLGSPDTIPEVLAALDGHCEAFGRDPSTILRTHTCLLIVDESEREARLRARAMLRESSLDERSFNERAIIGSPQGAAEQIAARLRLGLDGLMFFGDRRWSADDVALMADAIRV